VSLLFDKEYTVAGLMADLPLQRSARNQLRVQLAVLADGIRLLDNPVEVSAPLSLYTVGDFETLPIISTRLWGSPDHWRGIAEFNGLDYPFVVVPGQILRIPHVHVQPEG
jgi:nucleoid-associated protein YgaU